MSPSHAAGPRLNPVFVVLAVLASGALLYALLSLHSEPGSAHRRGDRLAGPAAGPVARPVARPVGSAAVAADPEEAVAVPGDHSMTLDVPALAHAKDVPVRSAPESATAPLRHGALHIEGTGLPWQRGANVYLAAHRLGFPGTKSHLLFWDLPTLEDGDKVLLKGSEGTRYEYRVFRELRVGPREVRVTEPVPGKSVVSLQTCTLPDYAERVVVQAELAAVHPSTARVPSQRSERR